MMLTELCGEINNYFDRNMPKYHKPFKIIDGAVENIESLGIQDGQYYRIIGSVFNDGVHKYTATKPDGSLHDETFSGSLWLMAIPQEVIDLAADIEAWAEKYKDVSYSPFASESLAPTSYSYSINTGAGSNGSGATWQNIFSSRLTKWRKTKP